MPVRIPPALRRRNIRGMSAGDHQRQQDSSGERYVMDHAEYLIILASLHEGVRPSEIARSFAQQGWLTVTERTFVEYIFAFKRRHPELARPPAAGREEDDVTRMIPGNRPEVDVDVEMDRAIRLQRMRVGISVKNERAMGVLIGGTVKEMEVLGKFIELKAKRKGLLSVAGAINAQSPVAAEVRDTISNVKKTETQQDKLFDLTKELSRA